LSESKPVVTEIIDTQKSEQQRLKQLELAVQPQTAEEAVELFVKSHQIRNGALLYAILTPEEQKRSHQRLAEQNWVLGVSSPWVKGYRIERINEQDASKREYKLQLLEYTSTGFMGIESVSVTVKKQDENWLIESYTPVQFDTDMDLWSENLTEDTVLGLVAEAQRRYWYIAGGGNGANGGQTFKPQGIDRNYRLLSEDIGTKEKLTAYLQEIFTADAVTAFINDQFSRKLLLEEAGQLAQPDGDRGSLLEWNRAKIAKLAQSGQKATATLQVPLGDQGVETFTIQFAYQKEQGWRIVTSPQHIY
jgi:hypothetical protein